jgi:hypothetical protein
MTNSSRRWDKRPEAVAWLSTSDISIECRSSLSAKSRMSAMKKSRTG